MQEYTFIIPAAVSVTAHTVEEAIQLVKDAVQHQDDDAQIFELDVFLTLPDDGHYELDQAYDLETDDYLNPNTGEPL